MTHSSQVGVLRNRYYSLMSERWLLVTPPRHAIEAVSKTPSWEHLCSVKHHRAYSRCGEWRGTLIYRRGGDWQTRDCFIAKRRRGADGRTIEGTVIFWPYARSCLPVLSGTDPRTKVTRPVSTMVIVMRGTYLYRKRVLFHWSRHSVYKGSTDRPVSCPPRAPFFLYFSLSRSVIGQGQGERCSQKHYKTQFPDAAAGAIFRTSEKRGWPSAGVQCVFRSTSIGCRANTKGRESLVSVTQNGFRVINTWNAGREIASGYVTLAT